MCWFIFWFVNLLPICQQNQEHSTLGYIMPRVLLTGFGPFGDHDVNPTEAIVDSFPSLIPIKNPFGRGSSEVSIEKHVLSVDEEGSRWTANELGSREWDAILHLGLCGECIRPRIEVRAQDLLDMRIPDNSGRQEQGIALSGSGDLHTPVPVKKWNIEQWDVDIELSLDAGQYICNETYYRTHEALNQHKFAIPCLFLHLPSSDYLSIADAMKLVRNMLSHMLYKPSIQVAAGIFLSDQGFLAMKRGENEPKAGKWEFPGGTIEVNETPEDALLRELNEELSIEANIIKKAGVWQHNYPFLHVEIHGFLVESSNLGNLQLSVHSEMKWISSEVDLNLDWLEADIPIVQDLLKQHY
jgi:8-oxo-dGTP diphosphatase